LSGFLFASITGQAARRAHHRLRYVQRM